MSDDPVPLRVQGPAMQIVHDIGSLRAGTVYWAPAVEAPERGWAGLPNSHRGSRYLIDAETLRPGHDGFPVFLSRADCLRWIMAQQRAIAESAPGAHIHAVRLDSWMLGLDAL
ncbi:hypothetical protein [Sphingomonas oryzagri]